jgi:hypothetical protein
MKDRVQSNDRTNARGDGNARETNSVHVHFFHARLVEINIRTRNRITPCTSATTLLEAVGNAADNAGQATRPLARTRAGASSSFETFSTAAGQVPSSPSDGQPGAPLSRLIRADEPSRFPGSSPYETGFLLFARSE